MMVVLPQNKFAGSERTGWRDEAISQRHRTWGNFAAAIDIDFVLIESTFAAVPKAIIEYKAQPGGAATHFQTRLLRNLGNMAGIPAFISKYWSETWAFMVVPINEHAREWMVSERSMTERQYVVFLQELRGVIEALPDHLQDVMPPRKAASCTAR